MTRNVAINLNVRYHPVGQGLFSSGVLNLPQGEAFCWVYDCGSTASKEVSLTQQVNDFSGRQGPKGNPLIDLLVLSHLDNDHVKGVVALLNRFEVTDLVIPLVPFWQRLVFLLRADKYLDRQSLLFMLDPVKAILAIPGAKVGRILLAPPAGQTPVAERPVDNDPEPDDTPQQQNPLEVTAELEDDNTRTREQLASDYGCPMPAGTEVRKLKEGGRIFSARLFEFIFYNDEAAYTAPPKQFVNTACALGKSLMKAATEGARGPLLKQLKLHYKTTIKSPIERNKISIFLYANFEIHGVSCNRSSPWKKRFNFRLLNTGDGFLDDDLALRRLTHYLGPDRLTSLNILQVMHHGSIHNWHPGLAQKLKAQFAVFPAGWQPKGHPDSDVVADFAAHSTVVSVDKKTGLRVVIRPCFLVSVGRHPHCELFDYCMCDDYTWPNAWILGGQRVYSATSKKWELQPLSVNGIW